MSTEPTTSNQGPVITNAYPCGGCGARVQYAPGTSALLCPYCGFQQEISAGDRKIREHDIAELATLPRKPVGKHRCLCVHLRQVRRHQSDQRPRRPVSVLWSRAVVDPSGTGQIVPEGVLPFALNRNGVRDALRKWASSRWFAPSKLKTVTEAESSRGTYLPHWTYDAKTTSQYTGERGEYYYVTRNYTDGQGKTQTRRERRTRWHPARGKVARAFDDVLVPATVVVPGRRSGSWSRGRWPRRCRFSPSISRVTRRYGTT